MKKRVLSLLLVMVCVMNLFACAKKEAQQETTQAVVQETVKSSDLIPAIITSTLQNIFDEKSIGLKSVKNARELGGYTTYDNKTVKHGLLLRSGHLGKLSDEDAKTLVDKYNLKEIIDFRSAEEISSAKDREIEGANYTKVQVVDESVNLSDRTESITGDHSTDTMIAYYNTLGDIYDMYSNLVRLELSQKGFRKFFDILLANDGATIFHCSTGKDRTGIAAAFILLVLGVDKETVLNDYEASIVFYKTAMDNVAHVLQEKGYSVDDINGITGLTGVRRDALEMVFDIIDNEYNGLSNYMHNQIGLTDEEINTLRAKYLE